MTMVVGSTKRVARRPAIRPRLITPPRVPAEESALGPRRQGGWMLPPPRTPAVRAARRPTLQIVDDEELAETASRGPAPGPSALVSLWRRRSTELIVAAAVVALAGWAILFVLLSAKPEPTVAASSLAGTKVAAPSERTTFASPDQSIPVIDVHSLPPAR